MRRAHARLADLELLLLLLKDYIRGANFTDRCHARNGQMSAAYPLQGREPLPEHPSDGPSPTDLRI